MLVIGAFIARSYIESWLRGTFHRFTDVPIDGFAIGTWVAALSLLAQVVLLSVPAWRTFAIVLGVLSLVVWIWFLSVVVFAFRAILLKPEGQQVTGRILLSTVATQSIAILAVKLYPGKWPVSALAALLILGYVFYALGTGLVIQRYLHQRRLNLADDWDNTNCILHGAMSISGLAGILTGVLPGPLIAANWIWAAAMLVVVEIIELARVRSRVDRDGWRQGLFTYFVSQWARNFTFGMFYAFTLHLPPSAWHAVPAIGSIRTPIFEHGQYVVLALLLIEIGLYLRANVVFGRSALQTVPLEPRKV